MKKCNQLTLATALVVGAGAQTAQAAPKANEQQDEKRQPNIVVIITDDLGYAGTGIYGGDPHYVNTPNMDKIGEEGVRFDNAYVTASTSGPSRAGLLSGQYQQRFGVWANCDLQAKGAGVPDEVKLMPRFFKDAGYNTSAIGKWHAGHAPNQNPLNKGFDEFYGFSSAQTDYFNSPILFDGRTKVKEHRYLTYEFTDRAVDFVKRNKDDKFFLYLAYNAVHDPVQAPQEEIDKFPHIKDPMMRKRAAMLHTLDTGIGKVMQTLKDCGIDDNTLVFFLHDNGGLPNWWPGNNGDQRGFKRERWEGGIHVQYMMRWPGVIDAGQRRTDLVSSLDILPTALAAAQIDTDISELDGVDISPLFSVTQKEPVRDILFWAGGNLMVDTYQYFGKNKKDAPYNHDNPPAAWAVRTEKWKLVYFFETGKKYLFDINNDRREENNLLAQYPEVEKELTAKFKVWLDKVHGTPQAWSDTYYNQLLNIEL